jgi:hypothetical protein
MAWSRSILLGAAATALALAQPAVATARVARTPAARADAAATAKVPGWRVVATVGSKSHPGLMEAVAAISPADYRS